MSEPSVPPDVNLDVVWVNVAAEVWRREPGPAERVFARLLRSPGLARALVTTPTLLVPWLAANVAVLGAGAITTAGTGQPLVWLLTPLLAAVGVAYAYGPGVDPAWELHYSMPVSERMVLLVRTLGVFAVDSVLGLIGSAASGTAASVTFGWLVPMTAVCALALATAVVSRSPNTGAAVGMAAWIVTVLAGETASRQFTAAVTDLALVFPYLAVAACCTAVIAYATRIPRGAA